VSAQIGIRGALYGLMAEFDSPARLIAAAERMRESGYRRVEAYTPYPIEELSRALGHRPSRMPLLVLAGGILGAVGGFSLQVWVNLVAYPLNIGGRPLFSWPAFIPVTFECTILVAALFAVLGMFALNGLPMPYHPVFNVSRFALASRDRYFLCVEAGDPQFDRRRTRELLEGLQPVEVNEVAD
jgi:hypothetical protein